MTEIGRLSELGQQAVAPADQIGLSVEEAIIDTLTNVMHFATSRGLDARKLVRIADDHFDAEAT